jgi:hypothetical protein
MPCTINEGAKKSERGVAAPTSHGTSSQRGNREDARSEQHLPERRVTPANRTKLRRFDNAESGIRAPGQPDGSFAGWMALRTFHNVFITRPCQGAVPQPILPSVTSRAPRAIPGHFSLARARVLVLALALARSRALSLPLPPSRTRARSLSLSTHTHTRMILPLTSNPTPRLLTDLTTKKEASLSLLENHLLPTISLYTRSVTSSMPMSHSVFHFSCNTGTLSAKITLNALKTAVLSSHASTGQAL